MLNHADPTGMQHIMFMLSGNKLSSHLRIYFVRI